VDVEALARGRVVQVDPIKPTVKGPGIQRLKLECHKLLSTVRGGRGRGGPGARHCRQGLTLVHLSAQLKRFVWDRGYTRPPFGST